MDYHVVCRSERLSNHLVSSSSDCWIRGSFSFLVVWFFMWLVLCFSFVARKMSKKLNYSSAAAASAALHSPCLPPFHSSVCLSLNGGLLIQHHQPPLILSLQRREQQQKATSRKIHKLEKSMDVFWQSHIQQHFFLNSPNRQNIR